MLYIDILFNSVYGWLNVKRYHKAIPNAFSNGSEWLRGCGLHPVRYYIRISGGIL